MSTSAIVLGVGLLSWWVARQSSLAVAFSHVYLPTLLLLPEYYTMSLGSLVPELSFSQAAIAPIGVALCWRLFVKGEWRRVSLSGVDLAVVAFLGWQVVATIYNLGTPDRRLVFNLVTVAFLPYLAARMLIEQHGLRATFARRFVYLICIVNIISIYEFKMGTSLFRSMLGTFFPGQIVPWFTQIRWGFGRIAGPYGHAIHMGVFVGVAYVLHRWLHRSGQWERRFSAVSLPAISKASALTLVLVAGLFMTLSRGPWLGALAGAVVAWAGTQPNRRRAFLRATGVLATAAGIAYAAVTTYVAGASVLEGAEEQSSAAYRAILLSQYEDIFLRRPLVGWGHANWPTVAGMSSIDNNYLYVALECGLIGVALLVILFIAAVWRMFASAYFVADMSQKERMFRFSLVGGLIVIASATTTTYIGPELYALTFLLIGWGEATLIVDATMAAESRRPVLPHDRRHVVRVIA